MKYLSLSSLRRNGKLTILLVLVLLEGALVAHLLHLGQSRVPFGFLVKNGDAYILFWKTDDQHYQSKVYPALRPAVEYAQNRLKLEAGHNPFMEDDLERLWMQDRKGAYVMFWKMSHIQFLNQLTFHRRSEADFYAREFRAGNYTTSPFGHSIFLRPASAE